ncbi:MAG: endonuclease/exonuclease/phosphatase family protein [Fulvivirga sp.]|nr:endonuclease/exonuclease/phosphatase family protein [Fulvivirga sp.]
MNRIAVLLSLIILTFASCEDKADDPVNQVDENPDPNGCVFSGIEEDFLDCVSPTSADQLEVITWNIRQFPLDGNSTMEAVERIIYNTDVDVIALQEIVSITDFNTVADNLEGWEAQVVNISSDLNMGYMYKTCEIESLSTPTALNIIEPRPTVTTTIKHINGLEVELFTLHLKCCGGTENFERRATASENLKQYIDTNLPGKPVIVLGDFNDHIGEGSPFTNFIADAENYLFTDMSIAQDESASWSYPSYPSHIDHILISDELFDNIETTKVITIEDCVWGYSFEVSDHRPVMAVFNKD